MHRVIIPVDFSETALSAARYTALMLAGKKDALAILYHNFEQEDDYYIVRSFMETLRNDLLQKGDAAVEYVIERGGNLIDNLERMAKSREATLIAMGITGKSVLQQALIGSNTLKMVDRRVCPIMIIPTSASYHPIQNVAFASDFKDVKNTTPVELIKRVLEMFGPRLHIVNIVPEQDAADNPDKEQARKDFLEMFRDYSPEFYFITMNDFQKGIDHFVKDHPIDILLTIPRHQSNELGVLKNSSHTRRLAYHSRIPVLAAHN